MTTKELEALRAEWEAEQKAKAEQAKRNKNTFTKVMNEFKEEFKRFDYKDCQYICRDMDNNPYWKWNTRREAYKVRNAIATLAKATFRVSKTADVPAGKEEQLRQLTKRLLNIALNEISPTA
jgi:hypothetical protein